jgi:hypothetical protein
MTTFRIHNTNNNSNCCNSTTNDLYNIVQNYPIDGNVNLPLCKNRFKVTVINLSNQSININTIGNNIIFDPDTNNPIGSTITTIILDYGYTMKLIGIYKNNILGWFVI